MEKPRQEDAPQRQRGGFRGRGRGRGGHAGDNREERSEAREQGQRGGFRGRGRGGHGDRPERRLQPIRLQFPEDQIKLNEVQAARVKELDEEIKKIGSPQEPSKEQFERQIHDAEMEIGKMVNQIELVKQKIAQATQDRQAYMEKNAPELAHMDENGQRLRQLKDTLNTLDHQIDEVKANRQKIQGMIKERIAKYHVRSREEAEAKKARLEDRIETETLDLKELKKLQADIDQLSKVAAQFDKVAGEEAQLEQLTARERELRDQRAKANEERKAVSQKMSDGYAARKEVQTALEKFKQDMDKLWAERRQLDEQRQAKYDKKKEILKAQRAAWDEYSQATRKKDELIRARKIVFHEAEKIMIQIEEGRKKIGDIPERANPHQTELTAALSLISYLEGIVEDKEDEDKETAKAANAGKRVDPAEAALLASIHSNSRRKKQQRGAKKEEKKKTSLVHSIDAMAQFATVEVSAPLSIEQIPACVAELRKKVKEWRDTFVKAVVKFDVQADGKVNVAVNLA